MRRTAAFLSALCFACLASSIVVPRLTGSLVDEANLFSADAAAQVRERIERFNEQRRAQLAVLTVDSLQGADIETYGIAVAEDWKLGSKKGDDGVLFLIAPKERRMRIEVGHGLEGELTDIASKRILADIVAPQFKRGQMAAGVVAGIDAIESYLQGRVPPALAQRPRDSGAGVFILFLFFIICMIVLGRLGGGSGWSSGGSGRWDRGGGGWGSGGGFGGGSSGGFSGGGGSFGGGGASSSW